MAIAFDTLACARKLKEAGFSDQQAEIQAKTLADIIDERLATKQDISESQRNVQESIAELRRDMQESITELRRDMQDLEYRLTIRLGAMIALAVTAVATLVKLL
jgi:uncharacterized FlaG/YvyC family protein